MTVAVAVGLAVSEAVGLGVMQAVGVGLGRTTCTWPFMPAPAWASQM